MKTFFWDNCIWIGWVKLSLLRREFLSSAVNVLTSSPKIFNIWLREVFRIQFSSQWSINMIKVLPKRFQECLGPFTLLLVKGSSEKVLFRHLSNQSFRSLSWRKYISYDGHHLFKSSYRFEECRKKLRNFFLFLRYLHLNWLC